MTAGGGISEWHQPLVPKLSEISDSKYLNVLKVVKPNYFCCECDPVTLSSAFWLNLRMSNREF